VVHEPEVVAVDRDEGFEKILADGVGDKGAAACEVFAVVGAEIDADEAA
jgi:hypothetical protein